MTLARCSGLFSMVDWSLMSSPEAMPSPMIAGGVNTLVLACGYFAAICLTCATIDVSCSSFDLRSFHGLRGRIMEATFSPLPPMILMPSMFMTSRTPLILPISVAIGRTTACVRGSVAPSGSWTAAKMTPWSSSGMNEVGVVTETSQQAPITAPSRTIVTIMRRASQVAPLTYPRVVFARVVLNHFSNPRSAGLTSRSM